MSILASTIRYLQRKRYQYEVTFSLYMLTPTEKFIFNSFIILFVSLTLMAASLYLPQHITFLSNRAWFYYHGETKDASKELGTSTEKVIAHTQTLMSVVAQTTAQAVGKITGVEGLGESKEL